MYKVIEKRKTDKLLPPLSITEDILEIARAFLDSAMAIGNAVGLAAPQVGLELRMCAVKAPHWFVVINPKITQTLGKPFKTEEGCLTWPDSDVIANRYSNVEVEYYSVETGRVEKQWYSGIESLIFQHECLHNATKVTTPDGIFKISELVKNNYSGLVLSMDINTGKISYKKVLACVGKPNNKKKKWVRLKATNTGPHKQLICTEDHMCACLDSPLEMGIKFKPAKELTNKYIIREVNTVREQNKEHALLGEKQISVLIGSLFGDGYIGKTGEGILTHGRDNEEYAKYRAKIFNGTIRYSNYLVAIPVTEQTKFLRTLFYDENNKRTCKHLLDYIDEIALAFWFMDDGCIPKDRGNGTLHTEGFSEDDNILIIDMLKNRFNVNATLQSRITKGGEKNYLYFKREDVDRIKQIIGEYVPECMRYKFTELPLFKENEFKNRVYSLKKVKEVCYIKGSRTESKLYDLTIEDNHTLFADNTLVHNCDHLDGVEEKLVPKLGISQQREMFKPNIGRNEPCPCESGKKYKKCCHKLIKFRLA